MEILPSADVGPLLFVGLAVASFVTAFIGVFTGAAGGVILLAIMAMVMPPAAVIPVHTVVMLGTGISRTLIMWRFVMRGTSSPRVAGRLIARRPFSDIVAAVAPLKREFKWSFSRIAPPVPRRLRATANRSWPS
jgi:hypothetical protein